MELLPPAKRGRPYAETMSPAGDINLSRKVIGELRKVYGAAASWPPCGRMRTAPRAARPRPETSPPLGVPAGGGVSTHTHTHANRR